eukprot:gene7770-10556_t
MSSGANRLISSEPKGLSPVQYKEYFYNFLTCPKYECYTQVENLLLQPIKSINHQHFSFHIICQDIIDFDPVIAYMILHFPKLLIPLFEDVLVELQSQIIQHPSFKRKIQSVDLSSNLSTPTVKKHCHVRFVHLPPIDEFSKPTISDIRSCDVDSLIEISGTIVRTGGIRMLEISKEYECQNHKCHYRFQVFGDPEQDNMLPFPKSCPKKKVDQTSTCTCTSLREIEGSRVCVDYQEIKIQDHIERLLLGSVPRSIIVILQADIVDKFNAGDDVIIVGNIIRQWRPVIKGVRCVIDIALQANSIRMMNSSEIIKVASEHSMIQFRDFWLKHGLNLNKYSNLVGIETHNKSSELLNEVMTVQLNEELESSAIFKARNTIVRSICPQLYGMFYVKLSVLLTLVGGTHTDYENGIRRRSQSHLLIVGDPGCGKSQLLRFVSSILPRSVLTTGIGTTGAGLTCTAIKDGSDWSLEAGALVLSNDGVCCIDEFASIKEHDRATIHEAMEQQTISVAKAGLVVKLNTRTTVIACCNPKGAYDVTADITTNTAIASPLLSRFDIIIVLLDTPNKEWDKRVSTFLLQQAVKNKANCSNNTANDNNIKMNNGGTSSRLSDFIRENAIEADHWNVNTLRQYITCVKNTIHPVLSEEARCLLMKYYQLQRQSDNRSSSRTTVRLLESLMRLSEAHAKIMFRNQVLIMDAIVAIHCISMSQAQASISLLGDSDSHISSIQEDFSVDPFDQYQQVEIKIMKMLHCSRESLNREVRHGEKKQSNMATMATNACTVYGDGQVENSSSGFNLMNETHNNSAEKNLYFDNNNNNSYDNNNKNNNRNDNMVVGREDFSGIEYKNFCKDKNLSTSNDAYVSDHIQDIDSETNANNIRISSCERKCNNLNLKQQNDNNIHNNNDNNNNSEKLFAVNDDSLGLENEHNQHQDSGSLSSSKRVRTVNNHFDNNDNSNNSILFSANKSKHYNSNSHLAGFARRDENHINHTGNSDTYRHSKVSVINRENMSNADNNNNNSDNINGNRMNSLSKLKARLQDSHNSNLNDERNNSDNNHNIISNSNNNNNYNNNNNLKPVNGGYNQVKSDVSQWVEVTVLRLKVFLVLNVAH